MLDHLTTEQRNPNSLELDSLNAQEIVDLMNREDLTVATAVQQQRVAIATAVDAIAARFRHDGRLFYLGAGTSGRLGVLDASECPPTFNSDPSMVVGIIAGGHTALTTAVEGAEDSETLSIEELKSHRFSANDVLVGIATSGRTPYVMAGLKYAKELGAYTIAITCNPHTPMHSLAEVVIAPIVGPEILSGSTRLKSGTATKMVLNMLTTGAMVLIGKTYGNLMVDLRATNSKLKLRCQNIVRELTGLAPQDAQHLLEKCDGELKTAVVCANHNITPDQARQKLQTHDNHLRMALTDHD